MGELVPHAAAAGDTKHRLLRTADNTYVIQIPRDQVYRVPKPENAIYIENQINEAKLQKKHRCGPLCWIIFALFLLALVALVALLVLRATLYKPQTPSFSVVHLRTKHLDQDFTSKKKMIPPEYEVMLRANNPNNLLSITYATPANATLSFNDDVLGNGGIRSTIKAGAGENVDFPVILTGGGLSATVSNSLNETKGLKQMNLKVEIPMEANSWLKNEKKDITVSCDMKVQNSVLMNKARISSQECKLVLE